MEIIRINEKISYIPSTDQPLSSDVGIINDEGKLWLYDVGNNDNIYPLIKDKYNVVLSHFHLDHIGGLDKLNIDELYVSRTTFKYTQKGLLVDKLITNNNVKIIPCPSSHAKGSLLLQVDNKYAFVGDSLYSKVDKNYYIYNSQLLKQQIDLLKSIEADILLVSHDKEFIKSKEDTIKHLEDIYALRSKDSNQIKIPR